LTAEQKEAKKLAKRILKAVKEPLEDATRKEAELLGRDVEGLLKKLDEMGLFASASKETIEEESPVKVKRAIEEAEAVAGASPDEDVAMADADEDAGEGGVEMKMNGKVEDEAVMLPLRSPRKKNTPASETAGSRASSSHGKTKSTNGKAPATEPLSPPISTSPSSATNHNNTATPIDPSNFFANGGIPWYLKQFDPVGTTVHEERYTGRAVLRDMSEELSDMDEDTLTELAVNADTPAEETPKTRSQQADAKPTKKAPKRKAKRNAWDRRRR
jgi:NuA3 HAT complex component NTO1